MDSGNWQLVVCGATHASSSLEQREPIQLRTEEIVAANAIFCELDAVMESAVVATCNRVEFYFVAARETDAFDVVSAFYRRFKQLDVEPHRGLFHVRTGMGAAERLFRVAAGVDSVVIGENQILGQIKTAYSSACAVRSAGKVIHRLFHQAFRVGKRVRSDTGIGKGACSVSTAAVEMISGKVGALESPAILFVGINQMVQLAARRLARMNGVRLTFANRTPAKAREFATGFRAAQARGFGLDRLPELLAEADVVISCTSSPGPVITRGTMEEAATLRRSMGRDMDRAGRGLVIVDLAIPRDVEAESEAVGGGSAAVTVYDMEDIKRFVADRQQQRRSEIPQAEEIIGRKLDEFNYWYGHVQYEPLYNGNGRLMEAIREEELAPIIEKLPPALQKQLNGATRRLVHRVAKAAIKPSGGRSE
jgi:glutamyl-tRNA reductase